MSAKEIRTFEGIFWVVLGVMICILAWTFDLGSLHEPAPGFAAFLSGLFLCSIGIVIIISKTVLKSLTNTRPDAVQTFNIIPWRRLAYTIGLLLGYTLFFNALGYILATFLLMYGMFYDWEKKSWASSLLFSILTVLMSYLVFEVWLQCQLPRGIFPWW